MLAIGGNTGGRSRLKRNKTVLKLTIIKFIIWNLLKAKSPFQNFLFSLLHCNHRHPRNCKSTVFSMLITQSVAVILCTAADLCGEVREKRDVHLLALHCEVLVQSLRGAFRVVDGGLVFLQSGGKK